MDACWPAPTAGEGTHPAGVFFFIPTSALTFTLRVGQGWGQSISTPSIVRVWDTQKSAVINHIGIDDFSEIVFPGVQGTITLVVGGGCRVYDEQTGGPLRSGELLWSRDHQLGAHWVHGESLRFATGLETDGRFVIDIRELQPTSDHPLLVVESFHLLSQGGRFSFSPVSFHASFASEMEVIIRDVRNSKILFQTGAAQLLYKPPGHFSPNGRFFAYGTSREEIVIWENTTAGYMPWSTLRPQLPFEGFLFSPSAISILSWGPDGDRKSVV